MEQQNVILSAPRSEAPVMQKLACNQPPKATFVPLKLKVRLLRCVNCMEGYSCACTPSS